MTGELMEGCTMRRNLTYALILVLSAGAAVQAAKFKSTWKAPDAVAGSFAGKKVAAFVIVKDDALRMSAEESLVRQLEALGVQGEASYRLAPREVMQDKDKAKAWFERIGVAGVVALRVVSADKVTTYTPSMWTTSYYGSWWGYYGNTWSAMWSPGSVDTNTVLTVETLIFNVPSDKLLWAAVSESTNPKNVDAFMKDLVTQAVKEMKKQGLAVKSGK
jgi:hypothetical protein